MDATPNFKELVIFIIDFIALLVPVIFALTFAFMAWKVIDAWVIHGGEEKSIDAGKQAAIAGVVALVCMIGIWGILQMLKTSLAL
jgi:hypothetical protein